MSFKEWFKKRCCLHEWGKWVDHKSWEKRESWGAEEKRLVANGIEQRRYCQRCHKMKSRIQWAGV